ncbi:hypothetical protein [Desulfonatronum parangueonense]
MIEKRTYINALKDGLSEVVKDDSTAEKIVDAIFSVPVKTLKDGNAVDLPQLGSLSIDKGQGDDFLTYHPENALVKCVLKQ